VYLRAQYIHKQATNAVCLPFLPVFNLQGRGRQAEAAAAAQAETEAWAHPRLARAEAEALPPAVATREAASGLELGLGLAVAAEREAEDGLGLGLTVARGAENGLGLGVGSTAAARGVVSGRSPLIAVSVGGTPREGSVNQEDLLTPPGPPYPTSTEGATHSSTPPALLTPPGPPYPPSTTGTTHSGTPPALRSQCSTTQRYHDREDASSMGTAGATANTTEGSSRASRESGCCVHIHTGNLSKGSDDPTDAPSDTRSETPAEAAAWVHPNLSHSSHAPSTERPEPSMVECDREDASSMVTTGATANTTVKNSRASRESELLCSHSHRESIERFQSRSEMVPTQKGLVFSDLSYETRAGGDAADDMLTPTGYPPTHTAAGTAHSAHSTQPALLPHRATPRVEDNTPADAAAVAGAQTLTTAVACTVSPLLPLAPSLSPTLSSSLSHSACLPLGVNPTLQACTVSPQISGQGRPAGSAPDSTSPTSIDSPCEREHKKNDSLDARLFPSVVLAVAPAGTMDEASSLSTDTRGGGRSGAHGRTLSLEETRTRSKPDPPQEQQQPSHRDRPPPPATTALQQLQVCIYLSIYVYIYIYISISISIYPYMPIDRVTRVHLIATVRPNLVPYFNLVLPSLEPPTNTF